MMNARWANKEKTSVWADLNGSTLLIQASPNNIGYRDLVASGEPIAPFFEPQPTIDDYKTAIQSHIDAVARAKDYDSGVSLASYRGSSVADYAADAEAFTAWRDPLWPFVFGKLAAVQSGTISQPTIAELVAMLPEPPWPLA
ncbi:hypothetical protein [Hyphomicrobium sp. DY-1]|uniref:hypothetical protein n=1 Tax=Hyphomicrobium sp. DY-1 TaxID=3075650 RepID=UPI0039C3F795